MATLFGSAISEDNPKRLKWIVRFFRIFIVFIVLGIYLIFDLEAGRFMCKRSENICEFQGRHIWELSYVTKKKVPLSDVIGSYLTAEVNDGKYTYQLMIETRDGNQRLGAIYSADGSVHEQRARQINDYLVSQDETLDIRESLWNLLFPFPFILMGWLFGVYMAGAFKKHLKELKQGKPILPERTDNT